MQPWQPSSRFHAKRQSSLVLALLAVLVTGCNDGSQDTSGFRVALLTPGSIADGGWNAGAYAGLMRVRDELGASVSHVETRTPAEFEENFRDYANRGYDLVFGHGFEYQDAAAIVGAEYPDTLFVTTSGNTVRPNVVPMVFELEQATYLCGVMAGRMSRTGRLGLIGGIDLPSIRSTFLAFKAGAEFGRPGAEVREVFIGNFDDTVAAHEAALALLEEGSDFLMHQANEAGRGVFQAVSEKTAPDAPVYAFGTNRNQNDMAPNAVIASATLDIPGALLEVARRVKEGRFVAEPLRLGMADQIVQLELNPGLSDRIPQSVKDEIAKLTRAIQAGELVVPRGAF
jgi:basic membrane lipoprotein Med (substrate-binding protein (PBP1-ABC) superfamily)